MRPALAASACTFVLFAGVSLAGVALVGCGAHRNVAVPGRSDLTLAQAEAFDDFPLYFAGERLDGLPLVAILRRNDTANHVSFVYGECEAAATDQGCAPPAEIQVWPRGGRSPERYESPGPASPEPEPATVRGTAAMFFEGGTRLELFAGPSTVVIFGDSRARVLAFAGALRCVRDRGRGPPAGRLDC